MSALGLDAREDMDPWFWVPVLEVAEVGDHLFHVRTSVGDGQDVWFATRHRPDGMFAWVHLTDTP